MGHKKFVFSWPWDKKKSCYTVLIFIEVFLYGYLWLKFFLWGAAIPFWFGATLVSGLALISINNWIVAWFLAPKKEKKKETIADRKAKVGLHMPTVHKINKPD